LLARAAQQFMEQTAPKRLRWASTKRTKHEFD